MHKIKILEKVALSAIMLFAVLFVAFLVAAQWPDYWKWIDAEATPMTWFEATLLYSCAVIAFGCAGLTFLLEEQRKARWWSVLGLGFFYFALDERFAIHERIRDRILAPRQIRIPLLPWIAPGDFILILYMVVGLTFLPFVLCLLKDRKAAFYCFMAAMGVAMLAVLMDSLDVSQMTLQTERAEQFWEELLEATSQLFFLSSFFLLFTTYLGRLYKQGDHVHSPDD